MSALVEFSLSLLLLVPAFQLGYSLYNYNRLVNAVRAGALFAAQQPRGGAELSVRNMVVFGDPDPPAGMQPIVPGFGAGNVQLTTDRRSVTVAVRGFRLNALFTEMRLDGRPAVTFPCARENAR